MAKKNNEEIVETEVQTTFNTQTIEEMIDSEDCIIEIEEEAE